MVKIIINRKQLVIFIAIAITIAVITKLYLTLPKSIYWIEVDNINVSFRADIRKADKIPVYPSEEILYNELMNPSVKNITLAFKPADEKENPHYIIQILEIIPKLSFAYSRLNLTPSFEKEPIVLESYENLKATEENPIIALVHPVYSDETAIRVEDHVIFLKAKNHKDFDLVTAKFIMSTLNITIG